MKIKFLGATHQVTGSSYLLEDAEIKILVDCGMFQERDYAYRNREAFPVSADQIQYLLLTHVHQDHCGLIPKLVKEGFHGEILLTASSMELFPIVILDSARIQEEDAAFKKNRNDNVEHKEPYVEAPLYTVHDAEKCFSLLKAVPYEEFLKLNDHIKVCFHDAGHILGSAMIEIVFQTIMDRETFSSLVISVSLTRLYSTIPQYLIEQITWSWSPPMAIEITITYKILMINSAILSMTR